MSGSKSQHEVSVFTADKDTSSGGGAAGDSNSNTSNNSNNGKERMTTTARNIRWINILSSDVWFSILRYLSSRDLLRCAITCTAWCELFLDWPHFWKTLDTELKLSAKHHQYVASILRHQETVHLIDAPAMPQFAREYWGLLADMRQCDTSILEFDEMEFGNPSGLEPVLKVASTNLERLIFKNCDNVPIYNLLADDWLDSCTKLKQLSLPRSWPWPESSQNRASTIPPRLPEQKKTESFQLLSLLHLHISVSPALVYLVPHMLRRCPNLESLALDSEDMVDGHGKILKNAFESCRKLQWIALTPCASARIPFYNEILDNEDYSEDGLYGLFLCGKYLFLKDPNDIYPLLKKSHATLRVLHMVYDGSPMFWHTLYYLGQLGVPKLKELSLNTLDGAGFHTRRCSTTFNDHNDQLGGGGGGGDGKNTLSFEQVFTQFIKRAPALQNVHLDCVGGNLPPELRVTEAIFTELGKRQHQSKLKRLFATHCCELGSLRRFCRTPSARLEQLSCDCGALNGQDLRHLMKKTQVLWAFETAHVSASQLYDPEYDRLQRTVRLRSFSDDEEARGCDCREQRSFSSEDRVFIKEILAMRK